MMIKIIKDVFVMCMYTFVYQFVYHFAWIGQYSTVGKDVAQIYLSVGVRRNTSVCSTLVLSHAVVATLRVDVRRVLCRYVQ